MGSQDSKAKGELLRAYVVLFLVFVGSLIPGAIVVHIEKALVDGCDVPVFGEDSQGNLWGCNGVTYSAGSVHNRAYHVAKEVDIWRRVLY